MTNSFSELVADYLQDIAYALRHPEQAEVPRRPKVEQSEAPADPSPALVGTHAILPRTHVDHLPGGSHFVEDEVSDPAGYFIFVRKDPNAAFRYRTTLDPKAELPSFVESAYLAILERHADEAGRGNYVMMLRESYLRHAELLKTLAGSDEFLNRSTRVVIVPQTSKWLTRLATPVETLEIMPAMDA